MNSLAASLLLSANLLAGDSAASASIDVASVVISAIEQVDIPARERGALTSVTAEEGQLLEKSQSLAAIDDGDALLAAELAETNLQKVRAESENTTRVGIAQKVLELATSELARSVKARQLFANAITDEEIEHRKLAVDRAKLEVEQAAHDLKQSQRAVRIAELELQIAERNVAKCQIRAPLAGIVVQVHHRSGEWVEPGQPVIRMVRLDGLRAEGFLAAGEAIGLNSGRPVSLTVEMPNGTKQPRAGVLKFISPEINPVDGRVRVWAYINNSDLVLRPGMRATMKIEPMVATKPETP